MLRPSSCPTRPHQDDIAASRNPRRHPESLRGDVPRRRSNLRGTGERTKPSAQRRLLRQARNDSQGQARRRVRGHVTEPETEVASSRHPLVPRAFIRFRQTWPPVRIHRNAPRMEQVAEPDQAFWPPH